MSHRHFKEKPRSNQEEEMSMSHGKRLPQEAADQDLDHDGGGRSVDRRSKTNPLLAHVKDCVVSPHEHITHCTNISQRILNLNFTQPLGMKISKAFQNAKRILRSEQTKSFPDTGK